MSNYIISTNMNLPVPIPGVDPGPQWATDVNSCLTILDQHNHTPGSGVPVPSTGLNINSDLPFQGNNATQLRTIRLSSQNAVLSLASDLGCLYEVVNDLYYNDGVGNQIRLTQSGAVAGTPGSIANLTSPASASYVSANQTFVFQSAANTPGNLDGGFIILRNNAANSKGLTLQPPAAMGSDYAITLPTLPASTLLLTMTSAGVISANGNADNSTLQLSSGILSVKNQGITQAKKAIRAVVQDSPTIPGSIAIAASTGTYTQTNTAVYEPISPSQGVNITTLGNPVFITFNGDGQGLGFDSTFAADGQFDIQLSRDGVPVFTATYGFPSDGGMEFGPASFGYYDFVAAGRYLYTVKTRLRTGSYLSINFVKLMAFEI